MADLRGGPGQGPVAPPDGAGARGQCGGGEGLRAAMAPGVQRTTRAGAGATRRLGRLCPRPGARGPAAGRSWALGGGGGPACSGCRQPEAAVACRASGLGPCLYNPL